MPHLFRFGFEGPEEFRSNSTSGTDFESSFAIWISAPSAGEALDWGREIAEQLVRHIFDAAGIAGYSWYSAGFAHWIEDEESVLAWARESHEVPSAEFGRLPDLDAIVARLSRRP